MTEATLTINGVPLTSGQSITVRVAVNSFYADIKENGLGGDDTGRGLAKGYMDTAWEVLELIHAPQPQGERGSVPVVPEEWRIAVSDLLAHEHCSNGFSASQYSVAVAKLRILLKHAQQEGEVTV